MKIVWQLQMLVSVLIKANIEPDTFEIIELGNLKIKNIQNTWFKK